MKKTLLYLILFLSITSTSLFVSAQMSATISVSPKNPSPRSSVTLLFESYSVNINTAIITWKVDGKVVLQGQGESRLPLRMGDIGESYVVTAMSESADGSKLEQSITITPTSVTLIYEAPQSYVPLLYKGRSLPANGALVKVTALPALSDKGLPLSPTNLSYTWYVNDTVLTTSSGLGKQSATFRLDYLRNTSDIRVVVRSPLGISGEGNLSLSPHPVMPVLYTHDPILGPNFSKAIQRRFEAVEDFTLQLEPYYISMEGKGPTFVWYLDGMPSTPLGGRQLSLRPPENNYGSKMLRISVSSLPRKIQEGEIQTELIYDTRKP